MHGWGPGVIGAVGGHQISPDQYLSVFFTSSPASREAGQEALNLCVPKTLSTSCDQAVFVDQVTDASLPSDAVVLKVDRFG